MALSNELLESRWGAVRVLKRRVRGERTVLVLHDLDEGVRTYEGLLDQPFLAGATLLLVDLLGFGHSEKPENCSYSPYVHAEALLSALQDDPVSHLHVMSRGVGTAVAAELGRQGVQFASFALNGLGTLPCRRGIDALLPISATEGEFVDREFPLKVRGAQTRGTGITAIEETGAVAYFRSAREMVRACHDGTTTEAFQKLSCEKYLLTGSGDGFEQNELAKILPGVRVESIPLVERNPLIENPRHTLNLWQLIMARVESPEFQTD